MLKRKITTNLDAELGYSYVEQDKRMFNFQFYFNQKVFPS
jgi:hypothetical protein